MGIILYDEQLKEMPINWKNNENSNNLNYTNNGPISSSYLEDEIFAQKSLFSFHNQENTKALSKLKEIILDYDSKKKHILISGSGTSFHNAKLLENILLRNNIFSKSISSSDLERYSNFSDSLIIAFSQSGETADLISPLKILKDNGAYISSFLNVPNSSIDNLSNLSIYLNAGKEFSVASTKAHTRAFYASHLLGNLLRGDNLNKNLAKKIQNIFDETIDENKNEIIRFCNDFKNSKSIFFMGGNEEDILAMEAALKFKELTYINANAYNVADFKHGPLSLIENGVPVVLIDIENRYIHNAREIMARGGVIIGVSKENEDSKNLYDYSFLVKGDKFSAEYMSSVLMQYLSLNMLEKLNLDPDKPRNLAKSVTVK